MVGNDGINKTDKLGLISLQFEGGCSEQQKKLLRQATALAEDLVNGSIASLGNVTDEKTGFLFLQFKNADTKRYERWFGSYDATRLQTVTARFNEIKNLFQGKIIFDCCPDGCNENWVAYVIHGGDVHVYLCPEFWKKDGSGKAGTIVHELSHEAPFYSKDHVYGRSASNSLASSEPAKAMENADNYKYHAN